MRLKVPSAGLHGLKHCHELPQGPDAPKFIGRSFTGLLEGFYKGYHKGLGMVRVCKGPCAQV